MKSDYVRHIFIGGKTTDSVFSEKIKNIPFTIFDNFSKSGLSAELENMRACNEAGQIIKPEELRYIILGNRNPVGTFRDLKSLFTNVLWIQVEESSF
jgi:hypothetical protein